MNCNMTKEMAWLNMKRSSIKFEYKKQQENIMWNQSKKNKKWNKTL